MDHAPAVLEEFSQYGPLTFITARPYHDPIADWLKATLGHEVFKKVRLVATGDHDGKVEHVREMDLQYFVEDQPVRLEDLEAVLQNKIGQNSETYIALHMDRTVAVEHLVEVMNICRNNNYKMILATNPN